MEILNNWVNEVNDLLWSYVLIIMLLGCAFWFTFKTRFVQFRMFREIGVSLLDHIVVAGDDYVSMAETGLFSEF